MSVTFVASARHTPGGVIPAEEGMEAVGSQMTQMHSILTEVFKRLDEGSSSQHDASGALPQLCHLDPLSLPINILHVTIILRGI